ncbi:MAG: zinc ribbon domain-containing protein [Candidatus Aphodosoma sp.]
MTREQSTKNEAKEITVEERLKALYKLQTVVSEIDKIRTLRGELPLEVQDLEDEVAGLKTRIENCTNDIESLTQKINERKLAINEARSIIAKKEDEKNNVRNNREFDALSKEIEYQSLEIELCEKNINDFTKDIESKQAEKNDAETRMQERSGDLEQKREELDEIIAETKQEEEQLTLKAKQLEPLIEPRLLSAFKRIRKNARNGLAVVTVERDACGGCFNKIPPQRHLDIKMRKKIIVCEYCGRILVDPGFKEEVENQEADK